MEDIERGHMINVFLVRNGATTVWQRMRQDLRGSVCIRAPGAQEGESPEGNAQMKEIIATAMKENFNCTNRRFDVFMTMSRGVDFAAEFVARTCARTFARAWLRIFSSFHPLI